MAAIRVEFIVEPFEEGAPGPHVKASVEAVREFGLEPEIGALGTAIEGPADRVTPALASLVGAAVDNGASRVSLSVSAGETTPSAKKDEADTHPLLDAIGELLDAVGGDAVPAGDLMTRDIPIRWEGDIVGGVRLRSLEGELGRLVGHIETELGGKLADLSRVDKQAAVRMLDERGAFLLRGSVEDVAEMMDVSRITIYNYLNAIRGD